MWKSGDIEQEVNTITRYYMVRRSSGKSEHPDWFLRGLDFAIYGLFPPCSTLLLTPLNIHIHCTCIEMSSEIIICTLGWARTWNWSTLSASSPRRYWKETTMLTSKHTTSVCTASMMLLINLNLTTLLQTLLHYVCLRSALKGVKFKVKLTFISREFWELLSKTLLWQFIF